MSAKLTATQTGLLADCRSHKNCALPLNRLYIKSNLIKITAMQFEKTSGYDRRIPDVKAAAVKYAIEIIRKNYTYRLTLEDISEKLHISREHLCRIFRQTTGMTVMEYIMRYRVMCSAEKLINSEESISEIAFGCGFDSASYFDKIFARYFHCTPGDYRKNFKKKDIGFIFDIR